MRTDFSIEPRVVMFVDIHNFTIFANALGERQADFLQAFYEELGELVYVNGGEIIKYLGDGMLCLFAASDALPAARCALAMRAAYAALIAKWDATVDTELEVGLGAGNVAVGVFGHESLHCRDIIGSVVYETAAIGHHRGVAMNEWVETVVRLEFETRQLPDRQIKWRERPLRVWELVA